MERANTFSLTDALTIDLSTQTTPTTAMYTAEIDAMWDQSWDVPIVRMVAVLSGLREVLRSGNNASQIREEEWFGLDSDDGE